MRNNRYSVASLLTASLSMTRFNICLAVILSVWFTVILSAVKNLIVISATHPLLFPRPSGEYFYLIIPLAFAARLS